MAEEPAQTAHTPTPKAPLWTSAAIIAAMVWDVLTTGQWLDLVANSFHGLMQDHFLSVEVWLAVNSAVMALAAAAALKGLSSKGIRAPMTILLLTAAACMAVWNSLIIALPVAGFGIILGFYICLFFSKLLFWVGCFLIFLRVTREAGIRNNSQHT